MEVQVSDLETRTQKKYQEKHEENKQEQFFFFCSWITCHFIKYLLKSYKSIIWNFLQIQEHKCQKQIHQSCLNKEHPVCLEEASSPVI